MMKEVKSEASHGALPIASNRPVMNEVGPEKWKTETLALRAKLDQIRAVCKDNAALECDAHMALKFIVSILAK